MIVHNVEERVAKTMSAARGKIDPDLVAVTAIGPDGDVEDYRKALEIAQIASAGKAKRFFGRSDWQPVQGGAIVEDGSLVHLRLEEDADVPAESPHQGEADVGAGLPERRNPETGTLDLGRRLATLDFNPEMSFTPPSWLAKGILPRKGIGLLFGESGAGKSFAAIHAALAVAWGQPLFGKRVKQGGVLYVAAEGGASVTSRFRAANDAMQTSVGAARFAGYEVTQAPIRIVTEAPDLSRNGDPAPLLRTIADAQQDFERAGYRLALVVIDTWHAAMGGGDENSAADAGAALKPLREASEAGNFHCLIVHHPGKDADRGARGTNALPAAADAVIAVKVPGFEGAREKPSTALRKATITKMRDGEAGTDFYYRLPVIEIGTDEDGEPWTTCVVEPCHAPKLDNGGLPKADRDFLEAVRAAAADTGEGHASTEAARLRFYALRPDAKPDAKRVAWRRALTRAIEAGRIKVDETDSFLWFEEEPPAP